MIGLSLLERLAPETTPHVDHVACLNSQLDGICDRCRQACPRQAISAEHRIMEKDCDGCWLCAVACPTLAIRPSNPPAAHFQVHLLHEGEVSLSCKFSATRDVSTACLAGLSETSILDLFAGGATVVTLDVSGCDDCSRQAGKSALARLATRAQRLLEAFGSGRELRLAYEPKSLARSPGAGLSRRELLTRFRKRLAQDALALASEQLQTVLGAYEQSDGYRCATRSRQLIEQLRWLGVPSVPISSIELPWLCLEASDRCSLCGLCASPCPTSALAVRPRSEALVLEFDVSACIGCGRCLESCPSKALHQTQTFLLSKILGEQRLVLAQQRYGRCPKCRARHLSRGHEELCPSCKSTADLARWLGTQLEKGMAADGQGGRPERTS